ncbi:MAG: DUF4091 domain-containing protein [Clostridia bacterium]|nr:DUF4091 domain-containing protein [Clostridia bacterium]
MIQTKIVSSLEKALLEENIEGFQPLDRISALKGERLSFQLLHTFRPSPAMDPLERNRAKCKLKAEGELIQYATLRDVCNVPVERPTVEKAVGDEDYISKRPGLFPDLLRPLHYENSVICAPNLLASVWVEINIPEDISAGEYVLKFMLDASESGKGFAESVITVEVINAVIPKEDIYLTQWMHCDCLANYYNVEVWSERHWEIVENFARVAVKNGINMLLTPVFTPPLDTEIGGERRTTQLVGVKKDADGYSFDFSLLDRWVEMCDRIGIKYFEISHLFTQWGAHHAPKVMAMVDGEYKRIFGWDTEAAGESYAAFLRAFLKALLCHMKKNGNDQRCFFHISDEPGIAHLESYKAAKAIVSEILEGYTIMDALSKYEFYKDGLVETPIPASNHIAPFIEANAPNLWTYYCCSQTQKVSNRFIAMTSFRNRSIGFQMYKYDIVGFLHWGYNFYANYGSVDVINPYLQQDGDGWVSPGDAYSVYPSHTGEALESLRIVVFYEALQDMKAMKLCEKYYGKAAVVKEIDAAIGTSVTFDTCAKSADAILKLREKINAMIKSAVENG